MSTHHSMIYKHLKHSFFCLATMALAGHSVTASAELLGVNPQLPLINFSGTGSTSYDATSRLFSVSSTPVALVTPAAKFIGNPTTGLKLVNVRVILGADGQLVGGVPGDDLKIVGSVDLDGDSIPDANGVLLTAEVVRFGYRETGTVTDLYDFVFKVTGGELANLYSGYDLALSMNSEASSFSGNFAVNFSGKAKGTLGAIEPQPQPGIEICTLVTLNGDMVSNFSDADTIVGDGCDSFEQGIPVGVLDTANATYKLRVTNTGSETLVDVAINAPDFGLVNVPLPSACGSLEPGEKCTITFDDPNNAYSGLKKPNVCSDPELGMLTKVATASGVGLVSRIPVTDDDPAAVNCVAEPHITLLKEVSLNGGLFLDANTVETAPKGKLGAGAKYRLTVTNDGTEALVNPIVSDLTLGLVNVPVGVGRMLPGAVVVLTHGSAGFGALDVAARCDSIGTHLNTARVDAAGELTAVLARSEDLAYVSCENPQIELLKQVSIDGVNFFDADLITDADVPVGIVGLTNATYRLIVKNIGSESLTDILVTDAMIGIDAVITRLAPGETRIISSGDTGFGNLYQADVCKGTPGNKLNVASVNAIGVSTGVLVSDENPANVQCIKGPQISIIKKVSLTGGAPFFDADTKADAPIGLLGASATYHLMVKNEGDEGLTNVKISDSTLGIANTIIADLPVGASVVITPESAGFQKLFAAGHCDSVGSKLNVASVSARGKLSNTTVNDENPAYVTCDAPVACSLSIDQTCSVKPLVSDDKLCTSAISSTTLRYTGPSLNGATVVFAGKDGGSATYTNVNLESNVTLLTTAAQNGYSVDAGVGNKLGSATTITINGKPEIIHTSCSAVYSAGKPAPLDSGTPYPPNSAKGDPSPNWSVVNFRQKDNIVMAESVGHTPDADHCVVPFGGADVTYAYKVRNTGSTNVQLNSVFDDKLGQILKTLPTALAAGESLAFTKGPVFIHKSTVNAVNVSANVAGNTGATCPAMDSVHVTTEAAPVYSCADGKPVQLVFEYTGQGCEANPANTQNGKFSCSGNPANKAPVQIVVSGATTDPVGESIKVGDFVTVTPTNGKFDTQTTFQIKQGGRVIQNVSIHLSCSQTLNVGGRFGGLILRVFTPGQTDGGMGGMGDDGMGGMGDDGMGGMGGDGMGGMGM